MDSKKELNLLSTKIKMLEDENIALSQNLEDLLLVNILNNQPVKVNDINFYLDSILEKLSILKSLQLTVVCKIKGHSLEIISYYSLNDNYDRHGIVIDLNHFSFDNDLSKPVYLDQLVYNTVLASLYPKSALIQATEIALFPFKVLNLGDLLLLIVDNDTSGSRIRSLEPLLASFLSTLSIRIENIKLNEDLKILNAELEERVTQRTDEIKQVNDKLKISESFLRSIIENEPECIKILDPEGNLIYMNPSGLKMIEVEDLEQVKGQCVYPMIMPEHRDEFIRLTNSVFNGEPGSMQFQMVGVKGRILWLETKAVPNYNDQGKIETLIGITRDITIRKKAIDDLKGSEKQLSLIFNNAPLIMFLLDSDFNIIKINQTCLNVSEKNEQQALGQKYGRILNCIHANCSEENIGKSAYCSSCMLQNAINHTLDTHESLYKMEGKVFMGNDENVFERDILISTDYIDINNNPSVIVSIDDITERVQLETVLREKTSILLKAQELAKIGEFYYDLVRNTIRLSSNLEKMSGYNKVVIAFEELYCSILPEDREDALTIFESALKHDERFSLQFRRIGPDGIIQHLFVQAEIERSISGKAIKAFGVVLDITEQKRQELDLTLKNYELRATEEELIATNDALRDNLTALEEAKMKAEESDRLKSAFLANMSHEIRTPMNAIMGFADLLDLEDMPFEKRKKFTKTIRERTKDLLNIINDILDISRLESHTLKIIETKGNINDKLIEVKNFFEIRNEEIYSKPIEFKLVNDLITEQGFIETDFERIKQVLINLIDNAYKFTSTGNITVGCMLKDSNTIKFYISDTGIGISRDKQQLIFERFRQADESYLTRDFGGAGLGLSICKGIIELMNGSIWVESEPNLGSTFCFTIPYKPINIKGITKDVLKIIKYDFTRKTILIVEDVDYNQDYLREILEETKAVLLFAGDGAAALQEFQAHPEIDAVLMDIRLPDINGLELTEIMRHERSDLKVIAQTAYASSDDQSKCFEAGCIGFISKPISQKLLLEMLNKYLE